MAFDGIIALAGTNFLAMTDIVAPESMMAVASTPLINTFMTGDWEICNNNNSALLFFEFSLSVCMGTGGGCTKGTLAFTLASPGVQGGYVYLLLLTCPCQLLAWDEGTL